MITTKIEQWVKIIALALLAVSALMYAGAENRMATSGASFSVDADATVSATPDMATFEFTVLTEGKDATIAQDENIKLMNQALDFVKESGVSEKDIQTTYYDIYPNYSYPCVDYNCESVIDGYTMQQMVKVKVRNTEQLGVLMSGVVENGATGITGPWFEIDDSTDLEQQAREEAFNSAREKAKQIAEAGGFRLGRIIDIYEWTDSSDLYYAESARAYDATGSGSAPEIATGEEDVIVNVTITYEIK